MDKFNPHVETKLHTLLARWKILMLQTLHVMVKKKVPHLKQDQQYVYH